MNAVLSKEKAYAAIITMVHMNDAHIISDLYGTFGFPAKQGFRLSGDNARSGPLEKLRVS